ncbi:hypothetical protein V6U90_25620 [Micromonospora sp. CPCC 206060]|uniref:hypothetical protein n=1 Tax=Micromonospora sp. CPCC 206060 TaxID=3122406 RepID=UPI002FF39808
MRMTVGPLPPAVYWRRRAVVLGAGLLFLIVVLYSCTGSGDPTDKRGKAAPTGTPTGNPAPTGSVLTPETDLTSPLPTGEPAPVVPAGPAETTEPPVVPVAPPPAEGACTDAEISVVPVVLPAAAQRGVTVDLRLKIKNVSQRTCSRDVGADMQELFIKAGADKVWSSDTCGTAKGADVRSFTPGFEREYTVGWNGRDSSKCASGVAAGPFPNVGDYQVFGRLGTKISEPVKFSITG